MVSELEGRSLHLVNRFSFRLRRAASAILLAATLSGGAVLAQPAKPPVTLTDGQKVEIREGDSWSAGTVVKKEGRKYLVHYEGGDAAQDEWVTADRLRVPAAPGTPAVTAPGAKPGVAPAPGPSTLPAKPKFAVWKVDDKVDCKWGGMWYTASVTNRRGNWYLVTYEGGFKGWKEWVEPWRLRKRGSTEDTIGSAPTNTAILPGGKMIDPPNHEPAPTPGTEVAGKTPRDEKARLEQEAAEKAAPVTPADFTALKEVAVGGGDVGALSPDPTPQPSQPVPAQPIVLAGADPDFLDSVPTLLFAGPQAPVGVVAWGETRATARVPTRILRINLAAGRYGGLVTLPVTVAVRDLSPDGKQLLAYSVGSGPGSSDRLDVWGIDTPEPKHVISFKPYDDRKGSPRDIFWARFVAPDRVATLNSSGRLIVFDLKGKAVWEAHVHGSVIPALSGGMKYLAVVAGETVAIVDPATGITLKLLTGATGGGGGGALSFKPDGTQLACGSRESLVVWDLKTGEVAVELSPFGTYGRQIDWVGDGYVLIDGGFLIGLQQKRVVWHYQRDSVNRVRDQLIGAQFGGRLWYLVAPERGKPVLASVVIPNERVKTAVAKLQADEQMLVQPGMKINLEVNLPDNIREKVTAALKGQLKANGLTVEDGAPLRLVAGTEQGEVKEMHYGDMMGPRFGPMARPETTMSVNSLISKLTLIGPDGTTLWEQKNVTTPPSFVRMKKDQSVQDAVNEVMQPQAGFFENTRIPKLVPKPPEPGSIGTSRLTAQGTAVD